MNMYIPIVNFKVMMKRQPEITPGPLYFYHSFFLCINNDFVYITYKPVNDNTLGLNTLPIVRYIHFLNTLTIGFI